jgi:hypothetical protein
MRSIFISLAILAVCGGCARYQASPLPSLCPATESTCHPQSTDLTVMARAYNRADCARYLDRDLLAEGYQPVQIYIQNDSDHNYLFSLNRVTLPVARADQVAPLVHTSTVGRAVGYGVAAIACWPLAIPAIVDGVGSARANDALDLDFDAKVARDQRIPPHAHMNQLLLVPINSYQSNFSITLMDECSLQPRRFEVRA